MQHMLGQGWRLIVRFWWISIRLGPLRSAADLSAEAEFRNVAEPQGGDPEGHGDRYEIGGRAASRPSGSDPALHHVVLDLLVAVIVPDQEDHLRARHPTAEPISASENGSRHRRSGDRPGAGAPMAAPMAAGGP